MPEQRPRTPGGGGARWTVTLLVAAIPLIGGAPSLAQTETEALTDTAAETEGVSDLRAELEAIENPKIIGQLEPPETLEVGRAVIRPAPGSRLYIFAVDGRKAGYILDGPAGLVYRVEDRFSIPAARHNLKRSDGVEVQEPGELLTMTTSLEGAAVWGWDLDLGEAAVRSVEGQAVPDWLQEILEEKFTPNPARGMVSGDHNGDAGYRWAVLAAEGEVFLLDVDPRPLSQQEDLVRLLPAQVRGDNPYAGLRFQEPVARQPIGRSWWQPETIEYVSVDTEIDVRNTAGEHVEVKTRTRLQSQRDGLRLLTMRHSIGAFDSDADWHDFRITELTVDGEPADHVHQKGNLLIALPRPVHKGDAVMLEVEAEGDIVVRPSGDNYWRLGGEAWYPKPGAGGQEWAEFRISAEVPSPYKVFAGGEVIEAESTESSNRVRTHLQAPMGYVMVVAGKYRTVSDQLEGARVHVSSYAAVKEKEADRIAQVVLSVMDCLGGWLGVPYPFQDLQVVELNQWGWGQAPPGIIFITQEAFLTRASARLGDETRARANLYSRGINERMSHEVAHAWFPHVAKVVRGEENWLSESLADYSSAVCLQEKLANKRKGKQLFKRQLQQWKNRSKEAGDATSVYLASHLAGTRENGWIRRDLLYGRGPLVLHAIREKLRHKHGEQKGDRMFLTWIRSYIRNFTFKVAETRHLIAILDQITGEEWQPFFERYIYGVESPEVD